MHMRNHVVIVGSYNTDLTVRTRRIPRPGETVIGGVFSKGGGGKGANQAVAAARAGAEVSFIARVGNDIHGHEGMQRLREEHVNTHYVINDSATSTGVAFIVVDELGENSIVVAEGANGRLRPSDIAQASLAIASARVLLAQLESPLDAVQAAIELAHRNGAIVMLNPAPAQPLGDILLRNVDIITPNRLEAEMITGMTISDDASLRAVAQRILGFGITHAIITLGQKGVLWASRNAVEVLPAYRVQATDSTGAGDVFSGSLAAFLAEGMTVEESLKMAIASASISVTRMGAQLSAPPRSEVEAFIAHYAHSETQALS
jgi:ribokinase